jgi:hypothetical protein
MKRALNFEVLITVCACKTKNNEIIMMRASVIKVEIFNCKNILQRQEAAK